MSAGLRLIVNADDFGMTEDVNRGVVEAHERGIVTSASIMATGPAFEHAVTLAKSYPTLDVGVHLTLTEQRPLTGAAAVSLVGPDGRFPPHLVQFAGRHLRGKVRLAEVRAELDAQIRKVRDAGIAVSHLDGHQHVHVLPGIAAVVVELAAKYGIGAVRYPAERVSAYMLRNLHDVRRLAEQVVLGMVCALSPLKSLRRSDSFVGFYFGGRLDEASLATVLGRLPARGTVELMCHPGGDDARAAEGYWQYSWSAERAALTSPRIRALIAARGAQLVSYRDV
ncbi:MAG TPA: ChbG/HpnK family deacetylase [Gammaproteobacteria bacterium]|nr:ChbG/HpnK family deacetylase [Gammaproteobacteria bacterium]